MTLTRNARARTLELACDGALGPGRPCDASIIVSARRRRPPLPSAPTPAALEARALRDGWTADVDAAAVSAARIASAGAGASIGARHYCPDCARERAAAARRQHD